MPNADGMETVSAVVPEALEREISTLAKASGMSRSRYVAVLMQSAASDRRIFRMTADVLADSTTPYKVTPSKPKK